MNVTKYLQYRQHLFSQELFSFLSSLNLYLSCNQTHNNEEKAQLGCFNILNKFCSALKKKKKVKTKCQITNYFAFLYISLQMVQRAVEWDLGVRSPYNYFH